MGRIRKDALDLEFLPETSQVKFIGKERIKYFSAYFDSGKLETVYRSGNASRRYLDVTKLNIPINCLEGFNPESDICEFPAVWPYLMNWIGDNDEIIQGLTPQNDTQQQIYFICSNMELKKIMLACYEERGWIIHAFRIRDKIFMHLGSDITCLPNTKTSDNIESKPQYNPKKTNKLNYARSNVIKKITEQVEECEIISKTEMDVLSTISFSTIGQHRILHTGFTEFVMSKEDIDKPIEQANFAALKLIPNLYKGRNGGFNISFYRHMYWWASALVGGVETLICGDLDDDFTLRKLDVLPASILNTKYHAVAQKKCLISLDKILHFIKSEVKEKNKVYDFHLDVETKEVIVAPSKIPLKVFIPPWCTSGATPDRATS